MHRAHSKWKQTASLCYRLAQRNRELEKKVWGPQAPEVFFLVSNHLQASSLASQERPKLPVTSHMFFSILESLSGRD